MSYITPSAVKLEMSQTFDSGTHTFPSTPALSSGDPTPSQARLRRGHSQSPQDSINVGIHAEDEKSKRPRASTGRGGRASVVARPHLMPGEEITYTPTTHRISKAKKGKKVHNCTFPGCPKIFTRAEHRKRHEANHNAHPTFQCQMEGCRKPFHRADLLARHMERQHNLPTDASSTRSGRSRGSFSDYSASPGADNIRTPTLGQQSPHPYPQASGAMSIDSVIENQTYRTSYRTHSVPPNLHLHDPLSSQGTGTAPRSLPPGAPYGLSPTSESIYSSSDSCYSPPSDYLQAPQPLSQPYNFGSELVQRSPRGFDASYPAMDASPLSMGPPTPVNGPCWANVDPAIVGIGSDSQYAPNQKKYQLSMSPSWTDDRNVPFYEMKAPPASAWPWMSSMPKVPY